MDAQQFRGQGNRAKTRNGVSKAASEKPCCSKRARSWVRLKGKRAGKAEGAIEKSSEQAC